jgi:hypothetical protein
VVNKLTKKEFWKGKKCYHHNTGRKGILGLKEWQALLDLIRLAKFAHMHSPTNISHDALDNSCWKNTMDLKERDPICAKPLIIIESSSYCPRIQHPIHQNINSKNRKNWEKKFQKNFLYSKIDNFGEHSTNLASAKLTFPILINYLGESIELAPKPQ